MNIFQVPVSHVEKAWNDGAHNLSEAVLKAGREITPDQLRLILTRGERILLGVGDDTQISGWAAVQIQQLPNLRVCYIYAIWAPGSTGPEAFSLLKKYAVDNGCAVIRGACNDAVSRLWEMKFQAKKVYQIMEIDL